MAKTCTGHADKHMIMPDARICTGHAEKHMIMPDGQNMYWTCRETHDDAGWPKHVLDMQRNT
jgi:hypothetical protein